MQKGDNQNPAIGAGKGFQPFMASARYCAEVMFQNATYIQQELDNVQMTAALKVQTEDICAQMIGTKHDVVHELFEIVDLLEERIDAAAIQSQVSNITGWIVSDIKELHQVVIALDAASKADQSIGLAYLLVSESATNVLQAFTALMDVTESL